jgi:hypothetical protein
MGDEAECPDGHSKAGGNGVDSEWMVVTVLSVEIDTQWKLLVGLTVDPSPQWPMGGGLGVKVGTQRAVVI